MGKRGNYSYQGEITNTARAKASNIAVHFKNTVETANAIRAMTVNRANAYLKNVLAYRECVPFKKFHGGVGRCAQAKNFKNIKGRWPKKSAQVILDLLKNAVSNSEYNGMDCDNLVIKHIQVNQAPLHRRRTFRAHGHISPYMGHHCHINVILGSNDF